MRKLIARLARHNLKKQSLVLSPKLPFYLNMNKLIGNIINKTIRQQFVISAMKTQTRLSSYNTSPFVCDLQPEVKYEETKNPEEWKYVERLLPPEIVPAPKMLEEYKSGWKPQTAECLNLPYFIKRSKNHMLPVYLLTTYRGTRKITSIVHIEGDIWALEKELKQFLKPMSKYPIKVQVHEFAGKLLIHGDYVNAVKHYFMERHF